MADQTTSFHEQLINAIPVPLFFKDRQGRFMGFNAAFASFIGRPRETLIGKTAFDLVPADVAEIYLAKDEELFANGGVQQYEAQLKNARGDLHDVIFRKAVFHNQTGEIDGLVGILLDITGQKQAELEIAAGRERLRRVIDTSKNCVAVKDEHGRYLLANDALAELVGSSKEAMIGKTDRDFIAMGRIQTPQEEMFTANDDKVIETGQTLSSEKVPFTSPDGTKRWFKTVKAPISFPNHPRSMLMIATDISDLHKANESLRNMELRLSTMLDVQPNLVVLLDPEQRILWANKAACKTSGLEREGLIGRRCHEVLHHSGACPDCPMPQAVQARRPVTETIQSPDNKIWRVTSAPVFDGNGHLVQTVDVAEDITEHLAMEGHLKRSQRLEAIGTLAAGIAHDFNNILSAILGFNDLAMESASFYPDIRENLEEVANAGRRARNLVAQILAFSRQTGTEKGPVPIHLIVKEILQLLRATFPSTIDIRKQIDTYGVILADPNQIHQVIMNLCTNAYHAMETQGGVLFVTLSETVLDPSALHPFHDASPGHYIQLTVSDTGVGMDADTLEHIYDPYFTTKEKERGTGLGLAVTYGIVRSHGGAIAVESTPGQGSSFKVLFPAHHQDTAAQAPDRVTLLPHGKGEHILFVDDEGPLVKVARQMLPRLGYRVETFTDSRAALAAFEQAPQRFDLVITDMTMPRMTGDQLTRECLALRSDMPIIICTGYGDRFSDAAAKRLGAKALVHKPLTTRNLAEVVRAVLDGNG